MMRMARSLTLWLKSMQKSVHEQSNLYAEPASLGRGNTDLGLDVALTTSAGVGGPIQRARGPEEMQAETGRVGLGSMRAREGLSCGILARGMLIRPRNREPRLAR